MIDAVTCRICRLTDAAVRPSDSDITLVSCSRCGHYSITGTAEAVWGNKSLTDRQLANAGSWVREHQHSQIGTNELKVLEYLPQPRIGERAAKILLELERQSSELGATRSIQFGNPRECFDWMGISWSTATSEVAYLFEEMLLKPGLINGLAPRSMSQSHAVALLNLQITPQGYAQLEEFRKQVSESHIGFCAMSFSPDLEQVWTQCIEPAIEAAGYEPKRIDGHQHNNKIDDEIIAMIRRSKFIVADFTGQRGGVYFEAGFAKGLGLEVIWTCRKDEIEENKVHFDNRQFNFVVWEHAALEDFTKRLQFRIEATLGKGTWIRDS